MTPSPGALAVPAREAGEAGRLFADGALPHARWPRPHGAHAVPAHRPERRVTLMLNTGRVRDQWHTMTRTGLVASLAAHTPEPLLAIHPADAAALASSRRLCPRRKSHGTAILRVAAETQRHGDSSRLCIGPISSPPAVRRPDGGAAPIRYWASRS